MKQDLSEGGRAQKTLTLNQAFARYMEETGDFCKKPESIEASLAWILRNLGKNKELHEVTTECLQSLIARKRQEALKKRGKPLSNGTLNRSITELFRRIACCAGKWKVAAPDIDWKSLKLKEAPIRVRELSQAEEKRLIQHVSERLRPAFAFALNSGLRVNALINLRWRDIDFDAKAFTYIAKGGRTKSLPLSKTLLAILSTQKGIHPEFVFTYVPLVGRTTKKAAVRKGRPQQITYSVIQNEWAAAKKAAGLENYRWHDHRHTFASRLNRSSKKIDLVKDALGHEEIGTTLRYAHTNMDELREAMDSMDASASVFTLATRAAPTKSPTKKGFKR